MNITVMTRSGRCYCRPDTTWEREDKDLFSPDSISSYLYTPVLFARISKAGKCVGGKFAERYYDSVGYGILLYAGDLFDGSPMAYAAASCTDHTSVLPFPMYNKVTLLEDNLFVLKRNGEEIYRTSCGRCGMIEESICRASALTSLRIGDMIATELEDPAPLVSKDIPAHLAKAGEATWKAEIEGTFCGNGLFCFNIIF